MKEFIEIPFGAKDSELGGWEYTIPEGYTASIENGKIIVKKEESEDERIRKWIINEIKIKHHNLDETNVDFVDKAIAWLEKQDEKQGEKNLINFKAKDWYVSKVDGKIHNMTYDTTLKVEPKFKVDNWIVDNCGYTWKIEGILNQFYILEDIEGGESRPTIEWVDKTCHLWILKDAKDGDILSNEKMIVIFKYFEEPSYRQHIVAYIGLDTNGDIQITDDTWSLGIDKIKPATKEQRDLLFQKMKEAGYEWDVEKKELKKIEQNTAWSEEDEHRAKDTIYFLDTAKKHYASTVELDACIDWLKSIKDRVQPQQEWGEEDEKMLKWLCRIVHSQKVGKVITLKEESELGEWMDKWLNHNPQPHWKPSDEQIYALRSVVTELKHSDNKHQETIEDLYNDLKKLSDE